MRIEIFSAPQCNYCNQAKDLLDRRGVTYYDFDISDGEHREELLRRLPRVRAIPQIFIDGAHIGGYEDLRELADSGELDDVLSEDSG